MTLYDTMEQPRSNVLLIVTIASRSRQPTPFDAVNTNAAYAHLSSLCAEANMNLYITHFDNILPDSTIFSWIYRENCWEMEELPISQLALSYADLPPNETNANRLRAMLIEHDVTIVNDLWVSDCLTDKVRTYELLPELIPATVDVADAEGMARLRELSTHPDLSLEKLILKPRFGERGKGIEVIDFSDLGSERVRQQREYIVQPFLESDTGIPELDVQGRHDLRMLVDNGEIIQLFVRVPAPNSHISSYAAGGKIRHFAVEQLPEKFRKVALAVDERLSHFVPRLYSVDVGLGRSGKIWIYELNTMPGIVWEEEHIADKPKYIRVHKAIADMLKSCDKVPVAV